MVRLIIEGVAGTGKTSVISSLRKVPILKDALFISEEETLGELFSELQDKSIPSNQHIRRLQSVLFRLNSVNVPIILERFHHSYFALGIHWDLLQSIDEKLDHLNFKTALLNLDDSEYEHRSLKRKEREHEGWESGFQHLYGSAEGAVEAFKISQRLRHQSLNLSKLPSQVFNTTKMEWEQTANNILTWCSRG